MPKDHSSAKKSAISITIGHKTQNDYFIFSYSKFLNLNFLGHQYKSII